MAESTIFREGITFLGEIGVYDVVLPFLLVFTIFFAILEKTKILGVDKVGDKTYTKKNLNAMVSFVVAFLVIASTQLVAVINTAMANIVLLLILAFSFLLLVGIFFKDQEFSLEKGSPWVKFFMIFMFIGIVIIFLDALNWLQEIFDFIFNAPLIISPEILSSIVFLIIILLFMWYIVHEPKKKEEKKE